MPENLQEKNAESEKEPSDKKKSSTVEDQKGRSYYYDDAYGYQIYESDDEIEDEIDDFSENQKPT